MKEACIFGSRSVPNRRLAGLLRAREIAAVQIGEFEVAAPGLWIGAPHVFVRDSRFLQSSDVQTNRGDPVVCLLRLGCTARTCCSASSASACWKLFAGLHRMHARARCPSGNAG